MDSLLHGELWSRVYEVVEVFTRTTERIVDIVSLCHCQTDERFMINVAAELPKGSPLCPESFEWRIQDASCTVHCVIWVSHGQKNVPARLCLHRTLSLATRPRTTLLIWRSCCVHWWVYLADVSSRTPGQHVLVCEGRRVNVRRNPASYKDITHVWTHKCRVTTGTFRMFYDQDMQVNLLWNGSSRVFFLRVLRITVTSRVRTLWQTAGHLVGRSFFKEMFKGPNLVLGL